MKMLLNKKREKEMEGFSVHAFDKDVFIQFFHLDLFVSTNLTLSANRSCTQMVLFPFSQEHTSLYSLFLLYM